MNLLDLPTEVLVMISKALDKASDINAFIRTSRTTYIRLNHVLYEFDVQKRAGKALVWAAQKNSQQTAKKSLQAGIKSLNKWFHRPLAIVLRAGYIDFVQLFLDEGVDPDTILFQGSRIETTALYIAASHGHDAIVKLLIEKGANVNIMASGRQPLVIAATNNRKTVVRLLLENGADPNARRDNAITALSIAVMRKSTEIVSMLLNKGANAELDHALQEAVTKGNNEITQLLLDRGADVGSRDYAGRTPLDLGVMYGAQRSVRLLLKHGADLNAQNSLPLHGAISARFFTTDNNRKSMIRLLLDHGVYDTCKEK
jgi:ankyrin repeat protein